MLLRQGGEMPLLERAGVGRHILRRLWEEIFKGEVEERGRKQDTREDGAVACKDGAG